MGRDAPAVDDDRLATARWGLCFAAPEVEQAYRRWFVEEAVRFSRIGLIASLIGWLVVLALPFVFLPDHPSGPVVSWTLLVVMPVLGVAYAATLVQRWRRAMLPLSAAANAVAGLVLVGPIAAGVFEQPEASGPTILTMLFAFAVFRLRFLEAVAAAGSYLLLDLMIVMAHLRAGELTSVQGVLHLAMPVTLFVMAMSVHLLRSRVLREAFLRERIIHAQRRVIEEERDRADRLLLDILPAPIAERLKVAPGVIADAHEDVTVLFADIVGFTALARELEPAALVSNLDELISCFDDLADRHGVEKIRTMGDGYLAAGGIPEPRPDHARAVVDLAHDMLAATAVFAERHGLAWSLRIGVHSGPVVAGVIGHRKFTYDLWGNTVNVASRLESTGEPGRVHVSEVTLSNLGPVPHTPRGPVELRNYGSIRTAFLDVASVAGEPAISGEGVDLTAL